MHTTDQATVRQITDLLFVQRLDVRCVDRLQKVVGIAIGVDVINVGQFSGDLVHCCITRFNTSQHRFALATLLVGCRFGIFVGEFFFAAQEPGVSVERTKSGNGF